ncbi:MAG TPA: DUF4129 domain-containing protein [Gaiellaceae bacterium]|nr:DUF4129 domain-containing protein [Gaiellaceae bacterium]
MRGSAGSAALPALVVLVLVAVVGVAATGSVPRGSNESRAPSETFLDLLFTLSIAAVIAGGVLLVYGLMQRKAIAKQIAIGRYPRFTLASFLISAGLLAVIVSLVRNRSREGGEDIFGYGNVVPTTPDGTEPARQYDPSLSWPAIVVVIGLVAAAVIAHLVSSRRSGHARNPQAELVEELAAAVDDALDGLRAEADPRRAVIAAYARLERVLAANGVTRLPSETPDEYLVRVLGALELTPDAIGRLTALFTRAKFSHHDVDFTMKESAIGALERVRDELWALRDPSAAERPRAPEAATS